MDGSTDPGTQNTKGTVIINFLTMRPESRHLVLTRDHFSPDQLHGWTSRLPIELPMHLEFGKAVNTVRFRLGLGMGYGRFYFNCLPEHEQGTSLRAVPMVLSSTPAREGLEPDRQVFVFIGRGFATVESPDAIDFEGAEEEAEEAFFDTERIPSDRIPSSSANHACCFGRK